MNNLSLFRKRERPRLKPLPLPEWGIFPSEGGTGAAFLIRFNLAARLGIRERWMPSRFNPLFPSWKGSDRHPFVYSHNRDLPIEIPELDQDHICIVLLSNDCEEVTIRPLDAEAREVYDNLQVDYRNWLRQEIDLAIELQTDLQEEFAVKLLQALDLLGYSPDAEPLQGLHSGATPAERDLWEILGGEPPNDSVL